MDDLRERFAVDKFHRHVRLVVVLAAGIDRDDVRVTQRGSRSGLSEDRSRTSWSRISSRIDLDRDLAAQLRIAAEVDGGHSPEPSWRRTSKFPMCDGRLAILSFGKKRTSYPASFGTSSTTIVVAFVRTAA